jgi:hypothetical protein
VKVYTPDGELAFERSADPEALVKAIEELLR